MKRLIVLIMLVSVNTLKILVVVSLDKKFVDKISYSRLLSFSTDYIYSSEIKQSYAFSDLNHP